MTDKKAVAIGTVVVMECLLKFLIKEHQEILEEFYEANPEMVEAFQNLFEQEKKVDKMVSTDVPMYG